MLKYPDAEPRGECGNYSHHHVCQSRQPIENAGVAVHYFLGSPPPLGWLGAAVGKWLVGTDAPVSGLGAAVVGKCPVGADFLCKPVWLLLLACYRWSSYGPCIYSQSGREEEALLRRDPGLFEHIGFVERCAKADIVGGFFLAAVKTAPHAVPIAARAGF